MNGAVENNLIFNGLMAAGLNPANFVTPDGGVELMFGWVEMILPMKEIGHGMENEGNATQFWDGDFWVLQ